MKKNELIPNIVGAIFLAFGIIAIINQILLKDFVAILWFCYVGLIIIGVGFLKKNKFLIKSQLNILLIPLIIWGFDFLYYLIFEVSLLNIVDYFFLPGPILSKIITTQHLFTIPLAVYSLRFIKSKTENAKLFSITQVSILFILSIIFSNPEKNINWVYHTPLNLNLPFYSVVWFIVVFGMIFITDKILKKI